MNKEQAILWLKNLPDGTLEERTAYLVAFGASRAIVQHIYNANPYLLGLEQGIILALRMVYGLKLEDLYGDANTPHPTELVAS